MEGLKEEERRKRGSKNGRGRRGIRDSRMGKERESEGKERKIERKETRIEKKNK